MTRGLERWYGGHDLHFITCSCYRPELDSGERRDLFLRVLERARQKYRFVVIGYAVRPEHFHLLITEPEVGNPSVVMKVVKERFTKLLHHGGMRTGPIWQKRFYDFSVSTTSMCAVPKSASRSYANRGPRRTPFLRSLGW
jgi:putative transposase